MKYVMSADKVVALFVNRLQDRANSPKNRAYYKEPSTLYSYGPHYVMARWLTPSMLLVSTRKYSVTTSGHMTYVNWNARRLIGVSCVSVHDAGCSLEQEMDRLVNLREMAISSAATTSRRLVSARVHIRHAVALEARIQQLSADGKLPEPRLKPWPDEVIALRAACVLRNYL